MVAPGQVLFLHEWAYSSTRQAGWNFWGQSPHLLRIKWPVMALFGSQYLKVDWNSPNYLFNQSSHCYSLAPVPLPGMNHWHLHFSKSGTLSCLSHLFLDIVPLVTVSFQVFTPQIEGRDLVNGHLLKCKNSIKSSSSWLSLLSPLNQRLPRSTSCPSLVPIRIFC